MKKVLSAEQMREVDRRTTEEYGLPSLVLMENAGKAVADAIIKKCDGSVSWKKIVVLCGKGNNGGDGAVISRILGAQGAIVTTLILGKIADSKGPARLNFDLLAEAEGVRVVELETESEILEFWRNPGFGSGGPEVIVDAVFGTGLTRPVEGLHRRFIEYCVDNVVLLGDSPLLVSVDLPSGVNSDSPAPIGFNFKPDLTVTFTSPKLANVMPPICRVQGELYIAYIGSPETLIDEMKSQLYLADRGDVETWMSETAFDADSYKKKRGSVLIIAGSKTYPGAAVLAGNGAMRSGAGIVTVATPESALVSVMERVLPEVMVRGVSESAGGAFTVTSFDELKDLAGEADAIAIGCGLTADSDQTRKFVRDVVEGRKVPVVVDADGLNALSPYDLKTQNAAPLILTPHEGEFKRLIGKKTEINDRVKTLRDFAAGNKVICVLKGERTLTAGPSGDVVVNPTGNPGLGKAGNGDNLAGLIAGFVAQTMSLNGEDDANVDEQVFRAVVAAVYVGGVAGDIAAARFGKHVMTASDVRDCLAEAFRGLSSGKKAVP